MKHSFNLLVIISLLFSSIIFISCKQNEPKNMDMTVKNYDLIGYKAVLTYPDFTAEVEYLTDSTLHWKTTTTKGTVAEGTEKVFLKKLNESQFFINWIEESGLTISQVIDMKNNNVTSFASFADETSSQGKRGSIILEGKFELVK